MTVELPAAGMMPLPAAVPQWHADALCAQTDPEAFFPDKGQSSRAAKRVCDACEVWEPCLAWGLRYREIGIWGGTSETQRRRMLRAAPGTPMVRDAGRLVRNAKILQLLDAGLPAAEVAAEVGCDERTVYRVLAASRGVE